MQNAEEKQNVSIAPAVLKIFKIMDGERYVGIEITNGPEQWFYSFDQDKWPSMRLGKFPRKSLNEEFERLLLFQFPDNAYDLTMFSQSLAEHIQKSNPALDKVHIANLIFEYFQIGRPIVKNENGNTHHSPE